MKYDKFNRRHFLIGSGAFTLALPHLVSLMPKAHAQSLNNKFFIFMGSPHGAIHEEHWAPRTFPTGTKQTFNLGSGYWNGYNARLADVAGGGDLTQLWQKDIISPIISKMNILEGFDIGIYLGHHNGLLGVYHRADQLDQAKLENPRFHSLDYFLSKSRTFDSSGNHRLVIPNTYGYGHSYYYNSAGNRVDCDKMSGWSGDYFKSLFPNNGSGGAAPSQTDPEALKRKSIIDRVLASYNGVTKSAYGDGKRISYQDRLALQEHLDGLRDLENKISAAAPVQNASCSGLPTPGNVNPGFWGLFNETSEKVKWDILSDMIVNSVRCGASRLWSIPGDDCNTFAVNDFHQEIPHMHSVPEVQAKILSNYRNFARHVWGQVVKKLNASSGANGGTLLDQGLVVWSHESGRNTHDNDSTPVVTAGSAGGFFKTGYHVNFIDYTRTMYGDWNGPQGNPGIHYNRWLANIALSMGVPASEFEKNGQRGYGPFAAAWKFGNNGGSAPTHATQRGDLSTKLPFITT